MSIPAHTLKKTFSIFFFSFLQVKSAVDKHTLDPGHLLRVVCGRALCSAASHFLYSTCNALSSALNRCCRQYYSTHIFHAMVRLDVPTWDDPAVASQINALSPRPPHTISWAVIATFVDTVSVVLRMLSQTVVLFGVLRGHKEGLLFALLTLASHFVSYLNFSFTHRLSRSRKTFTFFTFADWLTDLISLGRHHAQ